MIEIPPEPGMAEHTVAISGLPIPDIVLTRKRKLFRSETDLVNVALEVFRNGAIETGDLARKTGFSLQKVNHILERLQETGCVERERITAETGGPVWLNHWKTALYTKER